MCQQGTDALSRATPWLGQMGPTPQQHMVFSPELWPHLPLTERQWREVKPFVSGNTVNMLDPNHWDVRLVAGKDSFWHPAASLVKRVMAVVLDAQLQQPYRTSATMVVPATTIREYSSMLKFFTVHDTIAPAKDLPGFHPHLLIRMEKGQCVQPRTDAQRAVAESSLPTQSELDSLLGWHVPVHTCSPASPEPCTRS